MCGVEVTKRQMNKHKQSLKCQSQVPDVDKSNNNIVATVVGHQFLKRTGGDTSKL